MEGTGSQVLRSNWKSQFYSLTKRNLLVKRRIPNMTVWEFLMPIIFVAIYAAINRSTQGGPPAQSTYDSEPISGKGLYKLWPLAFVANTTETQEIANATCVALNITRCVTFSSVDDALHAYINGSSGSTNSTIGSYAVVFNNATDYTIRIPKNELSFSLTSSQKDECRYGLEAGSCTVYKVMQDGLALLQSTVDSAIVDVRSSGGIAPPVLNAQIMPEFDKTTSKYASVSILFPLYTVYCLAYITMFLSILITDDKPRKMLMTMMGLRPSAYWASFGLLYFALHLVLSIVTIIILVALDFFSTPAEYVMFWFVFVLYSICNIFLGFAWGTIWPKVDFAAITLMGTVALAALGLINGLNTSYADPGNPTSSLAVLGGILCLFPPACAFSILDRMYQFQVYNVALDSTSFVGGDLPLVAMVILLIFDVFLWAFIAMWLDGVVPNTLGGRLSWCFCFNRKYWKPDLPDPKKQRVYETTIEMQPDNPDVEVVPSELKGREAIRLFNIQKEFSQFDGCKKGETVKAVKGINFDIYEGEITALLGHNGAGKTTLINMMTGIMPSSDGTAFLYGYDVSNEADLQSIREMMGICPQQDTLLDVLSAREHLQLFASLKGVPPKEIDTKVEEALRNIDLTDQADVFAKNLSGGQKRKLSVGMALIGDPKFLFLDEPTAGMDPYSRRHLWSLLKKSRPGRVILLTTHFMDEADILADRKAVIAKGKLQCAGSSLYLKNKFGIGYQLNLVVEDAQKQESIQNIIESCVSNSTLKRVYGKEITWNLPITESHHFPALFNEIDNRKDELTVSSYGIAMTTLEEVFLKLGEIAEEEEENGVENLKNVGDSPTHSRVHLNQESYGNDPSELQKSPSVNTKWLRLFWLTKLRLKALLRSGGVIFIVFFLLLVGAGVILFLTSNGATTTKQDPPRTLQLDVKTLDVDDKFGYNEILYFDRPSTSNSLITELNSILTALSMKMKSYGGSFSKTGPFAAAGYDISVFSQVTNDANITVRYNHSYPMSIPIALNLLGNAYAGLAGLPEKINTAFEEWPDLNKRVAQFSASALSGLMFALAILNGGGLYSVSIVREREKNIKPLLRTAGVDINTYFVSYVIQYLVSLFPLILIALIILVAAQIKAFEVPLAGFLFFCHMVIQFFVAVMLGFCWSYAFDKERSAGNIVSINIWVTMLFFIPVMVVLTAVPNAYETMMIVHHVFCFITPYYALPGGLLMFDTIRTAYVIMLNDDNALPPPEAYLDWKLGLPSALVGGLVWLGILSILLRVGEVRKNGGRLSDIFKCCSNSISSYDPSAVNPIAGDHDDDDVAEERQLVSSYWNNANRPKNIMMMAHDLRKEFSKRKSDKPKVAVQNMTFHVEEGEVFGLLGPNGAGKTSTLNMIIAEHAPTAGQVSVDNIEVHSALSEAFEVMGMCPQFDALWPEVTVTELLMFFAVSAGLTEEQAESATEYYIKMLKIEEHKDKQSKHLSGGSRRKVSFAASLMGWPKLVLLDEPSTGLDPSSKRFLWDTIQASFQAKKRAAILTTHYMEEADALCTRIGIMVNGQLECLGTSQHLKSKYGDGYQLEIKLKESNISEENMANLKSFISSSFPTSSVIESFSDRILYAMPQESIESPGQIFGPMEENKQQLGVEEYSFSQATLEQVFLQFAKQQLEADEDESNAEKAREIHRKLLQKQKSIVDSSKNTHL